MHGLICCEHCVQPFTSQFGDVDRRPKIICANGHSFCSKCSAKFRTSCPKCKPKTFTLSRPIPNTTLMSFIALESPDSPVTHDIPSGEIELTKNTIGSGVFSVVYRGKWKTQHVAVKKLQIVLTAEQLRAISKDIERFITLDHPKIVRIFGSTRMQDGFLAIVTEHARDRGLTATMKDGKLTFAEKCAVSLDIVDALSFLEFCKIFLRYLDPNNILLFGVKPKAKIDCFQFSETLSAELLLNKSVKYTAVNHGTCCQQTIIYSLSVILYELFTETDYFPENTNIFDVIAAKIFNRPPRITTGKLPSKFMNLLKRGWNSDAIRRPKLPDFRKAILQLPDGFKKAVQQVPADPLLWNPALGIQAGTSNTDTTDRPTVDWNTSFEMFSSHMLRKNMVQSIMLHSEWKAKIDASVLKAMEIVPRHMFADLGEYEAISEAKVRQAYAWNISMPTAEGTIESRPEVAALQLSLGKIQAGQRVLVVGAEGGYFSAVAGHLVGREGRVIAACTRRDLLDLCCNRVKMCSSSVAAIITWKLVHAAALSAQPLTEVFGGREKFHAIIFCGSVPSIECAMVSSLLEIGGVLVVIVGDCQAVDQDLIAYTAGSTEFEGRTVTIPLRTFFGRGL